MKIALVHMRHAHSGGTELFLNKLSHYLAEKGEDVTIICRTHVETSHPNIKFVVLGGVTLGKAHRIWKFAKDVEKHVAKSAYDFVYGLGKTWTHDMLRIGGGTRMHLVNLIRQGKPNLKDKVAIAIERRSMARGAYQHIIANSHKSALEIQEAYHVPSDDISVIHNFVDTKRFTRITDPSVLQQHRDAIGLDASLPTFIFLGTGYKRKGLISVLNAFAKLSFKANLIIAGRESQLADYQQKAKELHIADACYFLGEKGNPELYFSLADCYVFPTQYEPFGFTVIEALSCGIPVITTDQCGAKEVINDKVSTILPKGFAIDSLTDAMSSWVNHQDKISLAQQCRDTALKLDVDVVLEENYQAILKQASKLSSS
ncbi:glycosyltransferase family 4 protein [Vibrio sp.]|nr:glycosyltransferase family 4 protein [Vibrio sp.]